MASLFSWSQYLCHNPGDPAWFELTRDRGRAPRQHAVCIVHSQWLEDPPANKRVDRLAETS